MCTIAFTVLCTRGILALLFLQSFANEDQLTMHKKKHDMMLNLGNSSKNTGFVGKYI